MCMFWSSICILSIQSHELCPKKRERLLTCDSSVSNHIVRVPNYAHRVSCLTWQIDPLKVESFPSSAVKTVSTHYKSLFFIFLIPINCHHDLVCAQVDDRKVHTHELLFFERRKEELVVGLLLLCVTAEGKKVTSHRLNDAWRHTWEKIVCYATQNRRKRFSF